MSYYSYIRTESKLSEHYFDDKRIVIDGDKMTLYINADNVKLHLSLIDDHKSDYAYSYSFDYDEFYMLDDEKHSLKSQLVAETLKLIASAKVSNNKMLIETIWEGKPVGKKFRSSRNVINYELINESIVEAFYSLEDFDYRSLEIVY